ncbi:MAG: acyl-CoA dehydrogenase family protein [Sciscionella sp.]
MGYGLAALNKLAGSALLDRFGARKQVERTVLKATRGGFKAGGAANRAFISVRKLTAPARLPSAPDTGMFDVTPGEEQAMIQQTVLEFAEEQLRPAAAQANENAAAPEKLFATAAELGITLLNVPEELGGIGTERSAVTTVLVAEALAQGDMGLAVAVLAPSAVASALALWGDAGQQSTYLPAFMADNPPAAALAVAEPTPLFDPFRLSTKAYRSGDGFTISGVKSLVPRVGQDELFLIAAEIDGRGPALFLVESGSAGLTVAADPSMGLRAAGLGTVHLEAVKVPATALLSEGSSEMYAEMIRLSRLGWAALAAGTARAVLDYVTPYVNERVAFGEPISHRQGVAFKVADIAIELEGLRLLTYRAAALAERGKPFAREVALARKLAVDKGMAIGSDGVQLLGGHGFTKEHPVERWYRDLRVIGLAEGVVLA